MSAREQLETSQDLFGKVSTLFGKTHPDAESSPNRNRLENKTQDEGEGVPCRALCC